MARLPPLLNKLVVNEPFDFFLPAMLLPKDELELLVDDWLLLRAKPF